MLKIILYFSLFVLILINGIDKYGKFEMAVNDFYLIKGPKRTDCTQPTVGVLNRTTIFYEMNITKPTRLTKGKVVAKIDGKDFIRMQMKNPCQHIFLKKIFMVTFNMTKNCGAPIGKFRSEIDINSLAMQYYGGSFIYGNLTFQTMLFADDCNFSCTIMNVTTYPRA